MTFDGQRQRKALTAAEQAIQALGRGDAHRAVDAAARAVDLDQVGVFSTLTDAVAVAVHDLGVGAGISDPSWDGLVRAVGPGPLAIEVETLRSK